MINTRSYYAAHCPTYWINRELGNGSPKAYKIALYKRNMITEQELNQHNYKVSDHLEKLLECKIRFEYSEMMSEAS